MDKTKALQNLLQGKATKKEIELLQRALASGEISIGGDVNRSVVIIGSGNNVELTSEALNLLKPETTSEEPAEGQPPYMGLRYFDTSDTDLFHGRKALTHELLSRVQKENFLVIVGASGSGKSSVARAGLIPAWQKENERGAIHIVTPTAHSLESLAASLTRESESVTATSTLMDDMNRDARSLRLFVKKMLAGSGKPNALLLVDQFEETFTLCKDPAERTAFIANLLALAEDDTARVVITLRADFYHHCAEYGGLRNALKSHQEYIGAMTADELRQAITTPAETNGWDFQPGLVDLILSDVGTEPGALPLLSHALLETWKRRQGHTLTLQGYHAAGGVKKAIAQTAESVYDRLTPAEQAIARGIFLRLTELGEGTQVTRRRVKLDELAQTKEQDAVTKVLKILADARLVTTEQDSAEVAHEALIREWGTLQEWLEKDRESIRLHQHLTESAQEWKQDGGVLYSGARLKQIQMWMKEHNDGLSPLEWEFLKASQDVNKQEKMRWVGVTGVGIVLLLIVLLLLIFVRTQTREFNQFILDMQDYWVTIPAGEFLMGSSKEDVVDALKFCSVCNFSDEEPQHLVYLDAYQIGKYKVTNRQYTQCIQSGFCDNNGFKFKGDLEGKDLHPVSLSWNDAKTYCLWAGGRLPTEAEWEKAARGTDGRIYPWGNTEPDGNLLNYNNNIGDTTQVGTYPNGISPYGLYDMAGNEEEWTSSLYRPYPYDANDGREDLNSSGVRVVRGSSWYTSAYSVRSAVRGGYEPANEYIIFTSGFRCARNVP